MNHRPTQRCCRGTQRPHCSSVSSHDQGNPAASSLGTWHPRHVLQATRHNCLGDIPPPTLSAHPTHGLCARCVLGAGTPAPLVRSPRPNGVTQIQAKCQGRQSQALGLKGSLHARGWSNVLGKWKPSPTGYILSPIQKGPWILGSVPEMAQQPPQGTEITT